MLVSAAHTPPPLGLPVAKQSWSRHRCRVRGDAGDHAHAQQRGQQAVAAKELSEWSRTQ